MCLAVPGKIINIDSDARATVDMMGVWREISLRLLPHAQTGDYVLVHAGFGIQVIDPDEAAETIALVRDLADLVDEDRVSAAHKPAAHETAGNILNPSAVATGSHA